MTTDADVASASFDITFDQTQLQVTGVALAAAAAQMTLGAIDLGAANASGVLPVSLNDASANNPVRAGPGLELVEITFSFDPAFSGPVAIELSNVALTDPASAPISLAQIVPSSIDAYPLQLTNQYLEWTWDNKLQSITPGERVGIRYEFINTSGQALDFYAEPDTAFDPYVNPYPGDGDFWNEWGIFHLEPGQTVQVGLHVWISSYTPSGYQIQIPVRLYEQNTGNQLGEGVLRFPVEGHDIFAPALYQSRPAGYIPVGQTGRITVRFLDGGAVTSMMATVRDLDTREAVASFPLTDDGANGDSIAGDHWFSANFTPAVEADFTLGLIVEDDFGNIDDRAYEDWHRFSSRPFQATGPLLVVSSWDMTYQTRELIAVKNALDELGYTYDHWDAVVRWPNDWSNISLPDSATLEQYA
ncbi:MAG TPA: hypothetical protein VJ417_05555, partial [Candidatus Glassbacteria bacterium]|nr:hypothetical protein [Candidatus Glassbacteria bacterium]